MAREREQKIQGVRGEPGGPTCRRESPDAGHPDAAAQYPLLSRAPDGARQTPRAGYRGSNVDAELGHSFSRVRVYPAGDALMPPNISVYAPAMGRAPLQRVPVTDLPAVMPTPAAVPSTTTPATAPAAGDPVTEVRDALSQKLPMQALNILRRLPISEILRVLSLFPDNLALLEAKLDSDGAVFGAGGTRVKACLVAMKVRASKAGPDALDPYLSFDSGLSAAEKVDLLAHTGQNVAAGTRTRVLDEIRDEILLQMKALSALRSRIPENLGAATTAEDQKTQSELNPLAEAKKAEILRLISAYDRLLEKELLQLPPGDPERQRREQEKERFEHFRMWREVEALSQTMITAGPAEMQERKKRKYKLDALLASPKTGFRKPVGTSGKLPDGRVYVVYEDHVKVSTQNSTVTWINNNPGNMIASSVALPAEFHNKLAGNFTVFPSIGIGWEAIPVQLRNFLNGTPTITIIGAIRRWAPLRKDNPADYAAAVVEELNKGKAKEERVTVDTPLSLLEKQGQLETMAEAMGRRVEKVVPGDIYWAKDVDAQPWIAPLLGLEPPAKR